MDRDQAFNLGHADGWQAALSGYQRPPIFPLQLEEFRTDCEVDYNRGAALGFERGRQRREENELRIKDRTDEIERDKDRWDTR